MLLRMAANVTLPAGKHELLVRALNGSRLFIDGRQIATTKFNNGNTSGHGKISPLPDRLPEGLRFMRLGHGEKYVIWESDGKPHTSLSTRSTLAERTANQTWVKHPLAF